VEDPLSLLFLDLKDTFVFQPWADEVKSYEYERAVYTIDLLGLNSRDNLIQARKIAFQHYQMRLREAIKAVNKGQKIRVKVMKDELQKENHPFVWQEMKTLRSRQLLPALDDLFQAIPEALTW
jgi:hypothetical protein